MKPIEIHQLMNSVLSTLESYGMVEKSRLKISVDRNVPENLYGDPEGLRKTLYMLLSMLSENLEKDFMQARVGFISRSPADSNLVITFEPIVVPVEPEKLRPFMEKISGTLERDVSGRLSMSIPVSGEHGGDNKTDAPPCSLAAIIREVQDDEVALKILKEYVNHLNEQILRLEQYLADGNAEGVHREAHSMKGGAMNICAQMLQITARALETSAKSNRLENGAEMLENIKKAYREIVAYVSTLPEG